MFRTNVIPEAQIYEVLSNDRRRCALQALTGSTGGGSIAVADLARAVAEQESGESPPPRPVRESVYNSLHQTHLPKLEALDIVRYDRDARVVHVRDRARDVDRYVGMRPALGLTWSEIYRTLGVCSLAIVTASLAAVPPADAVDPLLWASGSLLLFAVATAVQLWSNRWYVAQALRR